MRTRLRLPILVASVVALSLTLAVCGGDSAPTDSLGTPTLEPDVQATIVAQAQAEELRTPTPTVVPQEERAVVLEFVNGHASISRDWESFHADFDAWREGLIACDASTVEVTLRQFAGRFSVITAEARNLPRFASVRELADKVIQAVEREDAAIRRLRDTWRHDDPTVFEEVEVERAAALALQHEVQDSLGDLQANTSSSTRLTVGAYSLAFRQLESDWDTFHRSYDSFRALEADLSPLQMVDQLSLLIQDFGGVAAGLSALPASRPTDPVSETLARAAEGEELALRRLRGTFQKDVLDSQSDGAQDGITFIPQDPALFDAFDAQIVQSNSLRRQAAQALSTILGNTSEESEGAVTGFRQQYDVVGELRDGFHRDYDTWRGTEGGCNRAQAIAKLGDFALQFEVIATMVRELPGATFLRPLGELLVEAVEREDQSVRALRNNWRPFDAQVYAELDQERSTAGQLRRQVSTGIQDLMAGYGISPGDLGR